MVDRYKVVVGNVTATAHGAAHPEGEYVLWRDYEALRARVAELEGDLNVTRLQLGARVCSECPARARVAELEADVSDARGLMRGMIDAKDGRVARFLIERAERFIQRTADPTDAARYEAHVEMERQSRNEAD